jgi:2-dehydropantoate 2-reductase
MKYRIAVVGSGAIGSYYGGKLAASGCAVHFLMRGDLRAIREKGLRIVEQEGEVHLPSVSCYNTTAEIGPCDLVLVAVKTTSNADLPELIRPLLHDTTALLTLQNGLGNEEFIASHFGAERVMGGLCFICLTRTSRTTVERADYGHLSLGEFNRPSLGRTREIAQLFQDAGLRCNVIENLSLERWRKLVWNIPFNGLSVLAGGIDTAAILRDNELHRLTQGVMDEVIEAANRCGYPLERSAATDQIRRTETMGAYRPSTLLDFEAGRPLEIEAIWGEPLRRAVAAGAHTPRLEMLYGLLKSADPVIRARRSKTNAVAS